MSDTEVQEQLTDDEPETVEGEAHEEVPAEVASTALTIRQEREGAPPPAGVLPTPKEWEATLAVATRIAATPFVPESYRNSPESVVAAILTGRELGIGPMQSLRQIHMIDGRPAFAADLMLAKMRQGGLMILASETTATRAYIKARRRDTGEEAEVEWTFSDAELAGLTSKRNWKTYPADMLWARCVGRLARRLGSDLLGGLVYSSEEMQDWEDDGDYGTYGDYGVGKGYEATTAKPFNPEELLPDAPETQKATAEMFKEVDASLDWPKVISQAINHVFKATDTKSLAEKPRKAAWRRLRNTAITVWHVQFDDGDFPPITDEQIQEAFAKFFDGIVVEIPRDPGVES